MEGSANHVSQALNGQALHGESKVLPKPHVGNMTTRISHAGYSQGSGMAIDRGRLSSDQKRTQHQTVGSPEAVLNSMDGELSSGMRCFPGIRNACVNPPGDGGRIYRASQLTWMSSSSITAEAI